MLLIAIAFKVHLEKHVESKVDMVYIQCAILALP